MTEDFEFEILENLDCNLEEPFRLQKGELPRNKNEPTAYCPERIPVRLKSEDIGKFSIDAEISGDDEVAKLSSICFVVPVVDSLNKKGGNDIVGQENWSVLTQNWKEGSIASITLDTNIDDKKLDLEFDIWIFVYGLNDSIKLEITAEPRDVVGKPKSITINFESQKNAPLLPTNTGNSFNHDVIKQNERLGAYIGMGNKSSLHPKQVFTSNLLHQIIDRISEIKDCKLRIAYIGLDTGENYFSVNRTLRNLSNISDLTLIHHQEWDDRYMPILRPIIEKNLYDDNFDLTYISTNELAEKAAKKQEEGGIGEYDIIISTFVTSWSGSSVKSTLKNLMTEKTLLLSVEPTQPEFVARSYGSLSPNNIRETFLSSDVAPKMYQVELSNWADYTSDVIQWNAWSIVNNWKDLLVGASSYSDKKIKTKKRTKYIDAMLNEGPLINCAGYTLDCRELYYADIGEPSFEETSRIGKGEEENQFSDLQDMKFGIVGSAGVGKSIRFRQLFLERISLIKERNYRYRKTPIFIQAREFEKVVKKYIIEGSKHEYEHVEFDPYDGLVIYKLKPEDFQEFPYHVIIQILVDSIICTTPGLGKYLEKDLLIKLLEDEKYKVEIFIDGCDEVSSNCLKWIGILFRETFFDSRVNLDNYEGDAEFVARGNTFLDYIQEYEDVDEIISAEDKDNLKQYMPEDFTDVLEECDKWDEFHDEVFAAVDAMEEYLVAVIPHRSVTSSYSLSGRPNVKKFMSNVTDANQQRFFDQPYQYKLVELSPIDFSEDIHLMIFEGFCRALHIKQEPLQSLLMEVVSQNPDAWNHPFRIGWLVYFICEGKPIQEVGVGISTSSFEKLLIKHIASQSIHNLPKEVQHSEQVHASIVRVITGIACISHPTFGYKFDNKIDSIKSYLKKILKQWNFVLNTNMTIDEINHFFIQNVGLYSIDDTIHWHHQRVLDAAAAIYLEDESNVTSVFYTPVEKPDVFDDDILKNYPQLCRDRISLIVGSNNVTTYVFSELLGSKLSNSKLKFLYSILQKEEDKLEDYSGLVDNISAKLIENFHDFCPHGFASVQECIEYSNFGGLHHYFTNEHKFQLDTLLMRNMRISKISVSTLDNIHRPIDMVAKNLALRFESYINSSTKPIAMLGEIVLLGCDHEIINNSVNLTPHVTKYISECGDDGLKKAKHYLDKYLSVDRFLKPNQKTKVQLSAGGMRIELLHMIDSKLFENVIPAKKREAKSLYQYGNLDEFERYGSFSRIAQRSRNALQASRRMKDED